MKDKNYKEKQTLNPTEYLGLSHINKKDIHDVARYLEEIKKSTKTMSDTYKETLQSLKHGLIVRNLSYRRLSLEDKLYLLANLISQGNDEDKWLNPFIYDMKMLLKETRDELLATKSLSEKHKNILQKINFLLRQQILRESDTAMKDLLESINRDYIENRKLVKGDL